jgi:hypothetical protein
VGIHSAAQAASAVSSVPVSRTLRGQFKLVSALMVLLPWADFSLGGGSTGYEGMAGQGRQEGGPEQ